MARDVARRASRLRWLRKAQVVRGYGAAPRAHLRYVLADPELDTFSYDLANVDELVRAVADLTRVEVGVVLGHVAELDADEVLAGRIRRAVRWHPEAKRRPPLGRQLARYALARILAPGLVVECGTKHGLGSLVLLRALERNASEGRPGGVVVGLDPDPLAGWMVRSGTPGWERVPARSSDALPGVLRGRAVGMLVHDSVPDPVVARHEYEAALAAAEPALALAGNGGWTPVLRELAAATGVPCRSVEERPIGHFYPGAVQDLAVFRREAAT